MSVGAYDFFRRSRSSQVRVHPRAEDDLSSIPVSQCRTVDVRIQEVLNASTDAQEQEAIERLLAAGDALFGTRQRPIFERKHNAQYGLWLAKGYDNVLLEITTAHDRRMAADVLELTEIHASWYVLRFFFPEHVIEKLTPHERMDTYIKRQEQRENTFRRAFARREAALQYAREKNILPREIDGYILK